MFLKAVDLYGIYSVEIGALRFMSAPETACVLVRRLRDDKRAIKSMLYVALHNTSIITHILCNATKFGPNISWALCRGLLARERGLPLGCWSR